MRLEVPAHLLALTQDAAARLREPDRIESAIAAAPQQTSVPRSIHWNAESLAQGYAGLAVVCGYLDRCFPDQDWDAVGHSHLQLAVDGLSGERAPGVGLFSGITGVAFAAWCLSRSGVRYRRLSRTLDDAIVPRAVALARRVCARTEGLPVAEFDAISGLSGVAAYLLLRRDEPGPAVALRLVLDGLVALAADAAMPRWYTPAHYLGDEAMRRLYPAGNLNCGLAHGIPGPLAVLSLARHLGVEVQGIDAAVDALAGWLLAHVLDDEWGRIGRRPCR